MPSAPRPAGFDGAVAPLPDFEEWLRAVDFLPEAPVLTVVAEHLQLDVSTDISAAGTAAVDDILHRFPRLGRAARSELRGRLVGLVAWTPGVDAQYLSVVLARESRAYLRERGPRALWREWRDERRRDEARRNDKALLNYLDYAMWLLRKHQRAQPSWWRVPTMDEETFREHVYAELAISVLEDGLESKARPGKEATVRFLYGCRSRLRTRQALFEVSTPVDLEDLYDTGASVLDELVDDARQNVAKQALWSVQKQLTRTQRRWLDAFKKDVAEHDDLNLARVSATCERNRASAWRARERIQGALESIPAVRETFDDLLKEEPDSSREE